MTQISNLDSISNMYSKNTQITHSPSTNHSNFIDLETYGMEYELPLIIPKKTVIILDDEDDANVLFNVVSPCVIVDSTEDESSLESKLSEESSKLSEYHPIKAIHKRKYKKQKKNPYLKRFLLKQNIQKNLISAPILFNNEDFTRCTSLESDKNDFILKPIETDPFSKVKSDKKLKVGQNYQTILPIFNIRSNKAHMDSIKKNKIWDPNMIKITDFIYCKSILQNILGLSYFNDDIVCDLLCQNEYSVEKTCNYCLENARTLQPKIIESFIPTDPLYRKTRNSIYNKFLMRK